MEDKLEKAARCHQDSFPISNGDGVISGFENGKNKQSYESFISGAQWQLANMWTPVEEELPEIDMPVFVLTKNESVSTSKMYIPKDCYGTILGDKEWRGSYAFRRSITHWMPIPEFKKGE